MEDTHVLVFIFFGITYIYSHVCSWEIGNYSKYVLVINEGKLEQIEIQVQERAFKNSRNEHSTVNQLYSNKNYFF